MACLGGEKTTRASDPNHPIVFASAPLSETGKVAKNPTKGARKIKSEIPMFSGDGLISNASVGQEMLVANLTHVMEVSFKQPIKNMQFDWTKQCVAVEQARYSIGTLTGVEQPMLLHEGSWLLQQSDVNNSFPCPKDSLGWDPLSIADTCQGSLMEYSGVDVSVVNRSFDGL